MREVVALEGLSREDWLEHRRAGIGGSDVAAILGLSPYRGALDVYASKVTGQDGPETPVMRIGKHLEGGILQAYAEDTGSVVTPPTHLYAHDEHAFMLANPDGFTDADGALGVVEAKWSTAPHQWDDGPPEAYQLQTQHYLAVTGLAYADLAALLGRELRVYRIDRDDGLIDNLVGIEAQFWQRVVDRRPPKPDVNSEQALKLLYRGGLDTVELDDTMVAQVAALREAKARLKAAEADHDRLANEVRGVLGDHEIGAYHGVPVVRWGRTVRAGLDRRRLEADHPALVEQYRTGTPTRSLTLPRKDPLT